MTWVLHLFVLSQGAVSLLTAAMEGLEILSNRDGAWYDVDLSTTRIVEWKENLFLRVCLRCVASS